VIDRNKDILYRALNGERMSCLAKEYLVSNTFIAYTVHRQVKKVMPELYGSDIVRVSVSHTSNKPLMRELVKIRSEIIRKINEVEINKMVHKAKTTKSMLKNAMCILEDNGYTVNKPIEGE